MVEKRQAYTAAMIGSRYVVGLATEDEPGYAPVASIPHVRSWDEAQQEADRLNLERLKLTPEEAYLIVASSMRAQNASVRFVPPIVIEVASGVVTKVYYKDDPDTDLLDTDLLGHESVIVRDWDNIKAGDEDPLA